MHLGVEFIAQTAQRLRTHACIWAMAFARTAQGLRECMHLAFIFKHTTRGLCAHACILV